MREIKFRIFDTEKKEYVGEIFLNEKEPHIIINLIFKREPTYIFEQFTGYKDINDKEIYEGDIVGTKYHSLNAELYKRGKVEYVTAITYFKVCFGEAYITPDYYGVTFSGWYCEKVDKVEGYDEPLSLAETKDMFMAGNIHEGVKK